MIREIVHVSAGLRRDGGGTARLGRATASAIRQFCAHRGLRFRGLHLPSSDGSPALDGFRSFGGSTSGMAIALVGLALGGGRSRRLFFDHAGPARAFGWLPTGVVPRYAVQLHGIEVWRHLRGARRRAIERARNLIANSGFTRTRAAERLERAAEAWVVRPGLDCDAWTGERPDRQILESVGFGYLLIVGRMSASEGYKGHEGLIEAVRHLADRGLDARLVIVGDGDDRPRLERLAASSGLGDRARFLGSTSDATLAELYRRAALFAMPSTGEGFGLVFVEAMAAGLPCVALAGTAPAEIVVDGETGRLVAPDDPVALESALADLLTDPERARELGAAGRRRYEAEYTAEAFERRLEPVLAGLAEA